MKRERERESNHVSRENVREGRVLAEESLLEPGSLWAVLALELEGLDAQMAKG